MCARSGMPSFFLSDLPSESFVFIKLSLRGAPVTLILLDLNHQLDNL